MFEKAVIINIGPSSIGQAYWDKIAMLAKTSISLSRDDPSLIDELKDCDILLLGFQVPIGKDIFDVAPNLKFINILATAYGTIDLEEAKKRNITISNLGGYSTESVAEFTIAALLHEIRGLSQGLEHAAKGDFDFSDVRVRELRNSKFGVIGLGEIGGRVAELAAGFGAQVSYYSQSQKDTPFAYKDLDTLLKESDFVSVNVAETPQTIGLLDESKLNLLKPESVLVSTVPPTIIDTDALARRLEKGDITYISDHPGDMESQEFDKIKEFKNAIFYPSIAYISDEARLARQETFIANIEEFLSGNPQHVVS